MRSATAFRQCTAAVLIVICLSGCRTVSLGDAGRLAKAGQQSSTEISQFYSSSREQLPLVLEIEVLRSALEPGVSPPSAQMQADIARIKKSLTLRAKLADDLSGLYGSMYELAATNYAGDFQTSSQGLLGTINGLAPNAVSPGHAAFVTGLLGRLITAKQKQKVKLANQIVLTQLVEVQKVIAEDRQVTTSLRRATTRQLQQGGIALWRAGTLSAKPLLSRYAGVTGLELVGKDQDFTSKNPRLKDAVPALITYRFAQLDAAEDKRYDAMEETVAGLIKRHRELEAEAPIDLEWLLGQIAKLQELKAELKALRES